MVPPAWFAKTLQVPAPWKETTPAVIEQTADDAASTVNATVPPLVEVPVGVYVVPETTAAVGAVELKVIFWSPLATVITSCTWVAAFQLVPPAWLAFTLQVPTVRNETTPAAIEQTELVVASTVNATTPPLVDVAVGV